MQTDTAGTYTSLSASADKAMDFIIAIAGWPTLYSVVKSTYTRAALTTGGDKLQEFTGVQAVASGLSEGGMSMKGQHPEEGMQAIGTFAVDILDKRLLGKRVGSELSSRMAYLFANQSGNTTSLVSTISATGGVITLVDGTNFPSGAVLYVGQEAILLGDKVGNVYGGVTPCTRGYRLTSASVHLANVKVYDFMPNLYRRPIYVYKGYQSMTSTAGWLRTFGGIITDDIKENAFVSLEASANTWEMYARGTKKIASFSGLLSATTASSPTQSQQTAGSGAYTADPMLSGDFSVILEMAAPLLLSSLTDKHCLVKVDQQVWGITSAVDVAFPIDLSGYTNRVLATVIKGLFGTTKGDLNSGAACQLMWTNVDLSTLAGDEPVKLILKFLLSIKGDGANSPTYDVFREGLGLGIPLDRVNVASFDAVRTNYDYDANQTFMCAFPEAEDAKEFIEKELCKPFGYSLVVGNDGKINLKQHRSPQLIYVGGPNNELNFIAPGGTTQIKATLSSGVYTPSAMANQVTLALNAAFGGGGFSCAYNTSTNKFSISHVLSFSIKAAAPVDNGWVTLGFTSDSSGPDVHTADDARCADTTVDLTVSQNDMTDVVVMTSRDTQIASVDWWTNYNFGDGKYKTELRYVDAETVNIGDELGAREYRIKSKGLVAGATPSAVFTWDPFGHFKPSTSGCQGIVTHTPIANYFDGTYSWAELFSLSLLNRYRQPPLKFKCKLLWKHNKLEDGDIIKVSYLIDGKFTDQEMGTTTLVKRNFEVVDLKRDYRNGRVEVTLLGHRWQGF